MNKCIYCQKECNKNFCGGSCASLWHWSKFSKININKSLHNIIEGTLFSDAGLELNRKNGNINPRYYFKQARKSLEYVEYIAQQFDLKDQVKFFETHYDLNIQTYRKNDTTYDARFKTRCSPDLLQYYKRWYPNNIKIIPEDIDITPDFLLHAYIGDGNLKKQRSKIIGKTLYYPTIYTNSFLYEHLLDILIPKLSNIGILAKVRLHTVHWKGEIKKYPLTTIRAKSVPRFFEYIGKCPVKCFEYKWPNLNNI